MILRAALLSALTSLPAFAFSAYYYQGQPAKWDFNYAGYNPNVFNTSTKSIRFYIGSETASSFNRTAELNAIRACFAQWQSIPGTILKFEEAGLATGPVDINVSDGRNLIFWAKTNIVGGDNITSRAGYTVVSLDDENRILEADTALNGTVIAWNSDYFNTISGARFVESIALHEIGHFLGLDHTPLGGATVIDGGPGIGPDAGLSSDEIAAARTLYPAPGILAQLATISGTVQMNGIAVYGAMVTAENTKGQAICAMATDGTGHYSFTALPPDTYSIRVTPLNPNSDSTQLSLFRGLDIAPDFGNPQTAFLPAEAAPVAVAAGGTATVPFTVVSGQPAFRIEQISKPTTVQAAPSPVRYAVSIAPGQTMFTGVAGRNLPSDAVLSITGDGITLGPQIYEPNRFSGGLQLIQASVTVATNATPGLRSFVLRRGNDVAFANGYLEIADPTPDFNFDGLNDRFQRQYFPLFTAPEAGPTADPDGDKFSNAYEAATGTNPTDAQSFSFLIESVELVRNRALVTWKSDVGKEYQLYGKADAAGATWELVGTITATSESASMSDPNSGHGQKFYKLRIP